MKIAFFKPLVLNSPTTLTKFLINNELIDYRFNKFLNHIFLQSIKDVHIFDRVSINTNYQENSLNIYIVKTDKFFNDPSLNNNYSAKLYFDSIHNNIISYPPNIICIDSRFIALLIMEYFNATVSFGNSYAILIENEKTNFKKFVDTELENNNVSKLYLRYGNIDSFQKNDPSFSYIDSVSAIISDVFSKENFDGNFTTFFFSPIIYHELAHLNTWRNYLPSFFSRDGFIDPIKNYKIQESKADSISSSFLKENLSKENDPFIYSSKVFFFLEFLTVMRDLVLFDIYQNFRGLDARDVLFEIVLKDSTLSDGAFNSAENVNYSSINPPPLMTIEEYSKILHNIRSQTKFITYQHLLLRMVKLFELLSTDDNYNDINLFMGYDKLLKNDVTSTSLLDTLNKNSPQGTYPVKKLDISFSKAFRDIGQDFHFDKAISINNQHSMIGTRKDMVVEITGDTSNLSHIRMYRWMEKQNFDNPKQWAESMVIMLRFILNALEDDEEGMRKYEDIYGNLLSHKISFRKFVYKNRIITFSWLNSTNIIKIEVR